MAGEPISESRPATKGEKITMVMLTIAGLLLAVAIMFGSRHQDNGTKGPGDPPSPPLTTVTAESLYADYYAGNEVAADIRWKGTRLRVTGKVSRVRSDGGPVVELHAQGFLRSVNCRLAHSQTGYAASLKPGDAVEFTGECLGRGVASVLVDCR